MDILTLYFPSNTWLSLVMCVLTRNINAPPLGSRPFLEVVQFCRTVLKHHAVRVRLPWLILHSRDAICNEGVQCNIHPYSGGVICYQVANAGSWAAIKFVLHYGLPVYQSKVHIHSGFFFGES
ncbi:unnamed protein product [Choristocarpus tenellus]